MLAMLQEFVASGNVSGAAQRLPTDKLAVDLSTELLSLRPGAGEEWASIAGNASSNVTVRSHALVRRLMQFKTNHHTHVAAFIEQLQGSPPSSAALEKLEDHRAALRAASAIMGDASLSRGSDIFTGAMTACVEDKNSAKDMAAHAAAGLSTVDIFYSDVLSVGGIVASTNSVLGDKSAAGPEDFLQAMSVCQDYLQDYAGAYTRSPRLPADVVDSSLELLSTCVRSRLAGHLPR